MAFVHAGDGCSLSADVDYACTRYACTENGTIRLLLNGKLLEAKRVEEKGGHFTQIGLLNMVWDDEND